jgi:hypothetical protein
MIIEALNKEVEVAMVEEVAMEAAKEAKVVVETRAVVSLPKLMFLQ